MGNTSSQPGTSTQLAAVIAESRLPDMAGTGRAGSPSGDEAGASSTIIVVERPRTKSIADTTPRSTQQAAKKRKRTNASPTADKAQDVPQKVRKPKKARARPRDPTLLTREIAPESAALEINGDDVQDEEQQAGDGEWFKRKSRGTASNAATLLEEDATAGASAQLEQEAHAASQQLMEAIADATQVDGAADEPVRKTEAMTKTRTKRRKALPDSDANAAAAQLVGKEAAGATEQMETTKAEAEPQTEPDAEPQTEAQPEAQFEPRLEPQPEPQPESQPEPQPGLQPEAGKRKRKRKSKKQTPSTDTDEGAPQEAARLPATEEAVPDAQPQAPTAVMTEPAPAVPSDDQPQEPVKKKRKRKRRLDAEAEAEATVPEDQPDAPLEAAMTAAQPIVQSPAARAEDESVAEPPKKTRKRKQAGDATDGVIDAPRTHPDGRRISQVGRPGPRRRTRTDSVHNDEPRGLGDRTPADEAERRGPAIEPGASRQPRAQQRAEAATAAANANRVVGEPQAETSLPKSASVDEIMTALKGVLDHIVENNAVRLPDRERSNILSDYLLIIGDYLRVMTSDSAVSSQCWDIVARTAWTPGGFPDRESPDGKEGEEIYRKVASEESELTREWRRDRAKQHYGLVLPETVRGAAAASPTRRRTRAQDTVGDNAAGAQEGAAGPALTPPVSDHVSNWVQERVEQDPPNPSVLKLDGAQDGDDNSEYVPEADAEQQPVGLLAPSVRRKREAHYGLNINRTEPVDLPDPVDNGPSAGMFTDEEKAAADDVFDHVCQQCGFPTIDIRHNMIDWTNLEPRLKIELQAALPNRTVVAIRKFCQRRYITRKRGEWTAEEDEMLLRANEECGEKWEEVADLMDERTAQQCRDRYRDHLRHRGKQLTGPWSQDEEARLIAVVRESLEQIREANVGKVDLPDEDADVEKMLSWDTVADKMGGTRPRKRCAEKWQQLKMRHGDELGAVDFEIPAPKALAPVVYNAKSKKQRAVAKLFEKFEDGDTYDVLVEIATAIEDHSKVYKDESTVWSIVAQRNKRSRFNGPLRVMAYQKALKAHSGKKKVVAAKTVAAKAQAIVKDMERYAEKNGIEVYGRGFDGVPKPKIKAKKVRDKDKDEDESEGEVKGKKVKAKQLSKERVADSDEEDDGELTGPAAAAAGDDDNDEPLDLPSSPPVYHSGMTDVADENEDEDEPIIPETREEPLPGEEAPEDPAPAADYNDAVTVSSLNSRYRRRISRPSMGRREFLNRCEAVGRLQHAQVLRSRGFVEGRELE